MDIKIELRKLYALYEASIRFEHGVREISQPPREWMDFTPSRFIYAFFTFNSIYSYDWALSFENKKLKTWAKNEKPEHIKEEKKFEAYLKFVDTKLALEAPQLFHTELCRMINLFQIDEPVKVLKNMNLVNANHKVKQLGKQFPNHFENIYLQKLQPNNFYGTICAMLKLIYKVRCNVFHGVKTRIELLDPEQQKRLLIYTTILTATNSLLFQVAKKADIDWQTPSINFDASLESSK